MNQKCRRVREGQG